VALLATGFLARAGRGRPSSAPPAQPARSGPRGACGMGFRRVGVGTPRWIRILPGRGQASRGSTRERWSGERPPS
jgi:hypothetical protein